VTLLLLFFTLGDAATEAVSEWLFGWTRVGAYATQVFGPFQIVAVLVSYFGFALSGPPFLFYIVSVTLPYQWRTGLLLAPAVTLLAGLLACPRRSAFEHLTPEA